MDQHAVEYIRRKLLEDGEFYFNSPVELVDLNFTLTYRGPLPSGEARKSTTAEEHDIRQQFHEQLRHMYQSHPFLRSFYSTYIKCRDEPAIAEQKKNLPKFFVPVPRGEFVFLPLVTAAQVMVCELDILFLRNEKRGRLFKYPNNSSGDLDNRLKLVIDALTVPNMGKVEQLSASALPTPDQAPFCCLLEDDALVTAIRIESQRLLRPLSDPAEVEMIVRVTTKVEGITYASLGRSA